MNLRRLRYGELAAGAAGLVLLGSLFLTWYERDLGGAGVGGDADLDAWESFAVIDLLMLATGLATLAVVAFSAHRAQAVAIVVTALTTLLALLTTALVLFRLLVPPDVDLTVGERTLEGSRSLGLYLGALACLALTAGLLSAMRDERVGARGYEGAAGSSETPVTTLSAPPGGSPPAAR